MTRWKSSDVLRTSRIVPEPLLAVKERRKSARRTSLTRDEIQDDELEAEPPVT